jgi:hypothetical protein
MRLNKIQRYNIQNECLPLLDKMIELKNRRNEVEDERQKRILTNILERHYRKVYIIKADYDI